MRENEKVLKKFSDALLGPTLHNFVRSREHVDKMVGKINRFWSLLYGVAHAFTQKLEIYPIVDHQFRRQNEHIKNLNKAKRETKKFNQKEQMLFIMLKNKFLRKLLSISQ